MNSPIGVFDSGQGGLSVWRELRRGLPHESMIYFGDGANCPYGGRAAEEIRRFADAAFARFAERGVKLAVVACNTATIAAIDHLRARYDIPIVGMEPAVKPAAASTKTGVVAILATESSLDGDLFNRTAETYGAGVEIIRAPGVWFVELVESGREGTPEALEAVRRVVEPLIARGADRLVLGCTHYPFLRPAIERVIAGRGVEVVDPTSAVVRRVKFLLDEHGIAATEDNVPEYEYMTLAGDAYLVQLKARGEDGGDKDF